MPSGYPIPDPKDPDKTKDKWGDYTRPGDIRHSKCHDCIGFFLFMGFFAVMIAILILGLMKGHPSLLVKSWDDTGNFCGFDNGQHDPSEVSNWTNATNFQLRDLEEHPYVFFDANISDILANKGRQICVTKCPVSPNPTDAATTSNMLLLAMTDNCSNSDRICPAWITEDEERKAGGACRCPYPTTEFLNRCVPDDFKSVAASLTHEMLTVLEVLKQALYAIPGVGQRINAVIKLAPTIGIFAVISIVVSFLWVLLLRCMAPVIVYLVVLLVPALFVALGVWVWFHGTHSFIFQIDHGSDKSHKIVAGVCWAIAAVLVLILIFLCDKLKAAVAVIRISARAIGANWTIMFAPLISVLLLVIFWGVLAVSSLWNYSAASLTLKWNEHRKHVMLSYDIDKNLQHLLIFNLVYAIFIAAHIYFTNYYAQSAAIVDWYFMPEDEKGSSCNCRCLRGFGLALFKALGTITISALIMTPLYILIVICEYLDAKSKQDPDSISLLIKCLIKCMKCCLYCFEKFLRYLNKCLLTFAQIFNTHWCRSVKLTFDVLLSDVVMTLLMNGITAFIIILSKLVVAALTTLGFIIYVKHADGAESSWAIPAFFVFFLSFLASSFIIGIFTNVIDIIFVCYLSDEDLTTNAGVPMYIDRDTDALVEDLKQQAKDAKVEQVSDGGSSTPTP
jgi:hypothetical protein